MVDDLDEIKTITKEEEKQKRTIPVNDLDLQYLLTDPEWHKNQPTELKEKLSELIVKIATDEYGKEVGLTEFKKSLWDLLSFYKKDMRLAYLNARETELCIHYIDLASDCLAMNMFRSFIRSLSRAITIMEVSQSKGGFIRKMHQTIITGESKTELEPEKSNFSYNKRR